MTCPKGKGGRKPKTKRELELLGSRWAADRSEDPAVIRSGSEFPRPTFLSNEAGTFWDWWAPQLWNNGTLSDVDNMAMAQLCEAAAAWVDALGAVPKAKRVVTRVRKIAEKIAARRGVLAARREERSAGEYLLKLEREFGLTPVARTTVKRIAAADDTVDVAIT